MKPTSTLSNPASRSDEEPRDDRIAGRWRLLISHPLSGVENMALDEALLWRARASGEAVIRVYTWSEPTLSLGRNQAARGLYDEPRAKRRGIAIVRRPTGGRALLHHREITYSVTTPTRTLSLKAAYGRINRILVDALQRLGLPVVLAGAQPSGRLPDASPCFVAPSEGEIVLGGGKLVGSAQWREGDALLQHGSILIDDDQPMIAELMTAPAPPVPPPATLRQALATVPSPEAVAYALAEAIQAIDGLECEPLRDEPSLAARTAELTAKYSDRSWTWRR